MELWKTRSRRTILEYSKFLSVEEHSVELPDGRVIDDWPWVITPEFINAVPITEEGYFLCFRQTKYGLDGISLAPVGGYIEPGEEPLEAAQRELLEETGHKASEWIDLGTYRLGPNRGFATGHLFLACGSRKMAEPDSDELEEQELVTLTQEELEAALLAGEVKSMVWVAAISVALLYLKNQAILE
jgi:8-oxo-dGTP pyrophosphatase MutT (NUDIX family)